MKKILPFFLSIMIGLSLLPLSASADVADKGFGQRVFEKTFGTGTEKKSQNPFNENLVGEVTPNLPGELSSVRSSNPLYLINDIVRIVLTFLGIGTIIIIVYAGFRWMTAAGNDDAVSEAKKTLRNAVIGLILILMSFSLSVFIARRIQRETGSFGVGGSSTFTIKDATDAGFDALPRGGQEAVSDFIN